MVHPGRRAPALTTSCSFFVAGLHFTLLCLRRLRCETQRSLAQAIVFFGWKQAAALLITVRFRLLHPMLYFTLHLQFNLTCSFHTSFFGSSLCTCFACCGLRRITCSCCMSLWFEASSCIAHHCALTLVALCVVLRSTHNFALAYITVMFI